MVDLCNVNQFPAKIRKTCFYCVQKEGGKPGNVENLPNVNYDKMREKMVRINKCFQRVIFDVLSRYRSIAGGHMRNRENNKYDSGRIHPRIYKNKQCVLPLSTQ